MIKYKVFSRADNWYVEHGIFDSKEEAYKLYNTICKISYLNRMTFIETIGVELYKQTYFIVYIVDYHIPNIYGIYTTKALAQKRVDEINNTNVTWKEVELNSDSIIDY